MRGTDDNQRRLKHNLFAWLSLGLGVANVPSYLLWVVPHLSPSAPVLREAALLNLALLALSFLLSIVAARRAFHRPRTYRGQIVAPVALAGNVVLAVALCSNLLVLSSRLPTSARAPRIGGSAPNFALPDHRGTLTELASLRGRPVLLVFYRGHW